MLRSVAMTRGALPVRTVDPSSPKVTSRTQCSLFSMAQWSLARLPSCSGSARSAGMLVMYQRR